MENKLEQKYITRRYVHSYETTDGLYHEPMYELFGDEGFYETYNCVAIVHRGKSVYWYNDSAIKISDMEAQIAKIKAEGGTHLDIYYHGDHDSYTINGVKIYGSTEDEIAKHLGKKADKRRKEMLAAKVELEAKLRQIETELNSKWIYFTKKLHYQKSRDIFVSWKTQP